MSKNTGANDGKGRRRRSRPTEEQRKHVLQVYPFLRDIEDKEQFALRNQLDLSQLYNMASRMKATRHYQNWYDRREAEDDPMSYHPENDPKRLRDREPFDPTDAAWSAYEDIYLFKHFGRQRLEQISFVLGRTETALAYRARKLDLRHVLAIVENKEIIEAMHDGFVERFLEQIGKRLSTRIQELGLGYDPNKRVTVRKVDVVPILQQVTEPLPLRKCAQFWDVQKVIGWLGLRDETQLREYGRETGLQVLACCDKKGNVRIKLVDTKDLARMLSRNGMWQQLHSQHGADMWFIREVIESVIETQGGKAEWEMNAWISHGHTCLNPFSGLSFNLLYDGSDEDLDGANLHPSELTPRGIESIIY